MNRISKLFRLGSMAAFSAMVLTLLLVPSAARGQGVPSSEEPPSDPTYYGVNINQLDLCYLWEVDFANSIEESDCFTTDADNPDSVVDIQAETDQDLTWYEGYPDWPELGEDPNIAGLGAEAIAYDWSTSTELQDTGMYEGSLSGGDPPTATTPWNYDSTYTFSPGTWGDIYQVEGYYSECIDPTGTGSSSCSWNGTNDSGVAVYVQIEGPA